MAAAMLFAVCVAPSSGQQPDNSGNINSYPTKPIRLINPFPPGGGSDAVAHLVSQHLFKRWEQSMVVDNRGGAGGAIGTEIAARGLFEDD
jgi:tripartite-type tricarboxylate transporter receptor subunit TctC